MTQDQSPTRELSAQPLVERMRPFEGSVFAEMSQLAVDTGAINLGQGFPDLDGPDVIKESAIRAIREGRGNQYPPVNGIAPLREALATHEQRFYGLEYDPATDVVATTGASEALAAIFLALVEAGDEVIVLEPYFDIYPAGIAMAGATQVSVPLRLNGLVSLDGSESTTAMRVDGEAIRAAITNRTKLLVINTPHNPSGIVFNAAELQVIADIAQEYNLTVVSDEAYEHLIFPGFTHTPLATLPGMYERTITVGSAGKSFSFTGWKIGWAIGPARLIGAVRAVRQHLSFVSGGPFQWAITDALNQPNSYYTDLAESMTLRRDLLTSGLRQLGLPTATAEGTYFAMSDVRPLGYEDGLSFCRDLPKRAGVVAIPIQLFCDHAGHAEPYVRWAFCKQPAVLEAALEKMTQAFQ